MNLVDLIIISVLLLSLVAGWKIKSIRMLTLAASVLLGAWSAHYFQGRFTESFQEHLSPENAALLAWLTPFTLTALLVFMAGVMLSAIFKTIQLAWLDRISGALLAGLAMALVISAFLGWMQTAAWAPLKPAFEHSLLAPPLHKAMQPFLQSGLQYWLSLQQALFQSPKP